MDSLPGIGNNTVASVKITRYEGEEPPSLPESFKRFTIVSLEVQGDHSVKPPIKQIEDTIKEWLEAFVFGSSDSLTQKTLPHNYADCKLQVECRRIPSTKDFEGVKALLIPEFNKAAIEIRVRPKDSLYQWKAHLVFADSDIAKTMFCAMNPSAMEAQERFTKTTADQMKGYLFEEENFGPDPSRNRKEIVLLKKLLDIVASVKRDNIKRKLCFGLSERGDEKEISLLAISREISKITGFAIPEDRPSLLVMMVQELIDQGVIEIISGSDGLYKPTPLFWEYRLEHQRELDQVKRRELHREISKIENSKQGLAKEVERARARVVALSEQLSGYDREIEQKRRELQNLLPESEE